MVIIVSKNGKILKKINRTTFKEEAELQKYIYENPDCIPLEEIKENVQFTVLVREFPLDVGSIDVLGIDSDGDLYIIETKLYKNPDKRQVLAQVIDYGACLWESFSNNPDSLIQKLDQMLREKTGDGIIEKLESIFSNPNEIIEGIKQSVSNSTFHFIILMDNIHRSLKELILFMNKNSRFNVYAVELEYYKFDDYDIIIPHIFGAESKLPEQPPKRKKWDKDSFFYDIKKRMDDGTLIPEAYDAIQKMYDFSVKYADEISWGTGPITGSFSPKFYTISRRSIYTIRSDGIMSLNFGWLDDNETAIKLREALHKRRIRSEIACSP